VLITSDLSDIGTGAAELMALERRDNERIWREEGLKLPQKHTKRCRLFFNDGSCIRLRPEHKNHVWSYDFVKDRIMNGKKIRFLNIIDEFTHECLASITRRS